MQDVTLIAIRNGKKEVQLLLQATTFRRNEARDIIHNTPVCNPQPVIERILSGHAVNFARIVKVSIIFFSTSPGKLWEPDLLTAVHGANLYPLMMMIRRPRSCNEDRGSVCYKFLI